MRALHKWIFVLVSSFGLLFGTVFVSAAAGAQAKTKKSSSSGTKSGANADKTPVDLNTASEKDLDELPGVGPDIAHAEGAYKGSSRSQCPGPYLWPVFS